MQNDKVFYADPISWISPDADNSGNEDNSDDNTDAAIVTAPTRKVNLISFQILIFLHLNIF